jgi:hypothetical protein
MKAIKFKKRYTYLLLNICLLSCTPYSNKAESTPAIRTELAPLKSSIYYDGPIKANHKKREKSRKNNTKPTILIIGDSHSLGSFGLTLISEINQRIPNTDIFLYASCGSSPSWWQNMMETHCGYLEANNYGQKEKRKNNPTPNITSLIEKHHPSLLIIQQGTNLVPFKEAPVKEEISGLLGQVHTIAPNIKTIWIGPPDSRKYPKTKLRSTYSIIKSECIKQKTYAFNSLDVTQYPKSSKDGVHYSGIDGEKEAGRWAHIVAQQIAIHSFK